VDAIAPADRGLEDCDPDYVGAKVPDICDRELNAIFTITRQKKHIVFIADCCYSASIARDGSWTYWALPPFEGDHLREMLVRAQRNIDAWADTSQVSLVPVICHG